MAIQDIVFRLDVNSGDFQSRLQALTRATDSLNEGFDDVADSADRAASEVSQVSRAFNGRKVISEVDKVKKSVDGLGFSFKDAFSAAAGFAAAQGVLSVISELPTAIFEATAAQEQLEIAFDSIVGDAERARSLLEELTAFSVATPFEPTEVNNSAKALIAMGVAVDDTLDTLKTLGNVSSALNIPLNELAASYGKVQAAGVAQAEELNLFTERGIPIIAQLAEQFGVSAQEVKKLGSQSKITSEDIRIAFEALGGETGRFGGLMERQSQSLGGLLSTLRGEFEQLLIQIGRALTPLFYLLIDLARGMVSAFNLLGDAIELTVAVFTHIGELIEENKEVLIALTAAIVAANRQQILFNANLLITQIRAKAAANSVQAQAVATRVLTAAQTAFNNTLKKNPIGLIIAAVVGLVLALQRLYNENEEVRKAFDRIGASLGGFIPAIENITLKFARLIAKFGEFASNNRILESSIKVVSVAFDVLGSVVGWVFDKLGDLFEYVGDSEWGTGLTDFLTETLVLLDKLPANIFGALRAFEQMFVGIADRAAYVGRGIQNVFAGIFEGDLSLLNDEINRLSDGFDGYWNEVGNAYSEGVEEFYRNNPTAAEIIEEQTGADGATTGPAVVVKPVEIKLEADLDSVRKQIRDISDKTEDLLNDEAVKEFEFSLKINYDVGELSAREAIEQANQIDAEVARFRLQQQQALDKERQQQARESAFERLDTERQAEEDRIRELIASGKASNNDLLRLQQTYEVEREKLTGVYNQLELSQENERARDIMLLEQELGRNRLKMQVEIAKLIQRQVADTQKELIESLKSINSSLFQEDAISNARRIEALNDIKNEELKANKDALDAELKQIGDNREARENAIAASNNRAFQIEQEYYARSTELRNERDEHERQEFLDGQQARLEILENELQRGVDLANRFASEGGFGSILQSFQQNAARAAVAIQQASAAFGRNVALEALREQQSDLQAQRRLIQESIDELTAQYEAGNEALREPLEQRRKLLKEADAAILQNQVETTNALKQQQSEQLEAIADIAGAISDVVFGTINAVLQANIDKLNEQSAAQQNNVNEVRSALQQGGEAAKNYSAEQLEAEEQRLNQINQLRERDLRRQEAIGKAELLIQTAVAVAKAAAATSPFSYIGIAAALAALAIGLSQGRAAANSAIPSFGKGGWIDGPTHAKGGTLIEAEGGEFVVSRTAAKQFGPVLESMNEGKPFPRIADMIKPVPLTAPVVSEFQALKESGIDFSGLAVGMEGLRSELDGLRNSFESRFTSMQAAFERKGYDVYLQANKVYDSYEKGSKQAAKKGRR